MKFRILTVMAAMVCLFFLGACSTFSTLKQTKKEVVASQIKPAPTSEIATIEPLIESLKVASVTQSSEIPSTGNYTVGDPSLKGGVVLEGDFQIIEITENAVIIKLPFLKGVDSATGWQIYASYAWTDGNSWYLIGQNDYSVKTGFQNGLIATIPLTAKGNGWHWLRIWGKEEKIWLPILLTSLFARNDTQNNPAYEVLVNNKIKKSLAVPVDYSTRK